MIYYINGILMFNTDDGVLLHVQTGDEVKLTLPASRLLEILINSNGSILERDYLLTEVWDKHGLKGSGSNLNNYISNIRKVLFSFGISDAIITIPKAGFKISSNIDIACDSKEFQSINIEAEHSDTATPKKTHHSIISVKKACVRLLPFVNLSLVMIIIFFISSFMLDHFSLKEVSPHSKNLIEKCDITYLQNYSASDQHEIDDQVIKVLNDNKLSCTSKRMVVFDYYPSLSPNNPGRTLIAYCRIGSDNEIVNCDNIYYNAKVWR